MLHMWHWKWLLWYYTTWLWDTHFRWAQSGQLHVSVPPLCHSVYMYVCKWANIKMHVFYRFFLMYLINKDETEHTGQVSLIRFITVFFFFFVIIKISIDWKQDLLLSVSCPMLHPPLKSCSYIFCFRSHTSGRCTRSAAGTSSLLETVSESNMRISFPSWQILHTYGGKMTTIELFVFIIPDKITLKKKKRFCHEKCKIKIDSMSILEPFSEMFITKT